MAAQEIVLGSTSVCDVAGDRNGKHEMHLDVAGDRYAFRIERLA